MTDTEAKPDRDLLAYLREHDLPCPHCSYNLRNVSQLQCPECGKAFAIGHLVKRDRPIWPFVITLAAVASCLFESLGYWAAMINYEGAPYYGSVIGSPPWGWASRLFWYAQAPLLVVLPTGRRQFARLPVRLQAVIAFTFTLLALIANRRAYL